MLKEAKTYGHLWELVTNGFQVIDTRSIDDTNVDEYFYDVINILSDGIELPEVQAMKVKVIFFDRVECTLTIMDFLFNLLLWPLVTCSGRNITSKNLFFEEAITKSSIKKYVDNNFVKINMKTMPTILLNQSIDRAIGKFRALTNFQPFLANTINLKDTIDLMNQYPEFWNTVHFNIDDIPLEDIKDKGMEAMNTQVKYIKNSDHCLRDAFVAGEGVNKKQYKEVAVNIGSKPNGLGSVFPHPIKGSFINTGLQSVEELVVESSIGRIAQMLKKQNVGDSGAFARKLGLNNIDSKLHMDPTYVCDTRNFQEVEIKNSDILDMYDMRYYKFKENGPEYLLDAERDRHLIGSTLYFRSPMTCNSAAKGHGICYRCYGDLAYVNRDINVGQIAAELLSAIYTQILLSAKHLLESAIVKLEWLGGFYDLFTVQFNLIGLKEDIIYKGFKLIIDPDDITENEDTDDDEVADISMTGSVSYITSFIVQLPDGRQTEIRTKDNDDIYIHDDLFRLMNSEGVNADGIYELDMNKMRDISLFEMDVKNNELARTMKQSMNIINNKNSTKSYNRNTILQAFLDNNLAGGVKLNAVHYEVILMNQIRNVNNVLASPDWSHPGELCQIMTLDKSLAENKAISIRLQSSNVGKVMTSPSNRLLEQASIMDLFAMERPQDFMSDQIPLSDYQMINEEKKPTVNPIYFFTTEDSGDDEGDNE